MLGTHLRTYIEDFNSLPAICKHVVRQTAIVMFKRNNNLLINEP